MDEQGIENVRYLFLICELQGSIKRYPGRKSDTDQGDMIELNLPDAFQMHRPNFHHVSNFF